MTDNVYTATQCRDCETLHNTIADLRQRLKVNADVLRTITARLDQLADPHNDESGTNV